MVKKISFFQFLYLAIAMFIPVSVSALSDAQLQVINQGIYYFNVDDSSLGYGLGGTLGNTCYGTAIPQINDPTVVAKAIDNYIGTGNPFSGLGTDIVAGATRAEVNPFLVVAIAQHESSYGTAGIASQGSFNAFGRTADTAGGQPSISLPGSDGKARDWYKWASFKESVNWSGPGNPSSGGGLDEPAYLNAVYVSQGLTTLDSFVNKYAPSSDNNDPTSYVKALGNAFDAMISGAGDAIACGVSGSATGATFSLYSQYDPRWANLPYGAANLGDISAAGCGPTSMAMVVTNLTNQSITPDVIAKNFGSYHVVDASGNGAGSSHALFGAVASFYGLKAKDIGTDLVGAARALASGSLVIAAGTGTAPFTGSGHVLVLRGITADGKFLLGDPNTKYPPDKDPENTTPRTKNQIQAAGLQGLWVISK